MSKQAQASFTALINEHFDEDHILTLEDMALILLIIREHSRTMRRLYSKYTLWLVNVLLDMASVTQNLYLGVTDVTRTVNLLYNNNVSKDVTELIERLEKDYYTRLRARLISYAADETPISQVEHDINDGIFKKSGKQLSGEASKMMTIYRTEYTRTRSQVKDEIFLELKSQGVDVFKQWVYTYESQKARHNHLAADGLHSDHDGMFIINGKETSGPGLFGDASEDINCRCDMALIVNNGPK